MRRFPNHTILTAIVATVLAFASCRKDDDYPAIITRIEDVNRSALCIMNCYDNPYNVHPKVLYFPTPVFMHKYWMCYTPYPGGKPRLENPSIAYSDDGLQWKNIANTPLHNGYYNNNQYNSDPCIVFNRQKYSMECWYRFADANNPKEIIYRQVTHDGINWSKAEILHHTTSCSQALAPSVIIDENGLYHIWLVCHDSGGRRLQYFESTDGKDWRHIKDIEQTYEHNGIIYDPWHADITLLDNRYFMVMMAKATGQSSSWILFYSESTDNTNWTTPQPLLLPRADQWDAQLYKACIVKTDDLYRLYYSARRKYTYFIGLDISNTPYKFNP